SQAVGSRTYACGGRTEFSGGLDWTFSSGRTRSRTSPTSMQPPRNHWEMTIRQRGWPALALGDLQHRHLEWRIGICAGVRVMRETAQPGDQIQWCEVRSYAPQSSGGGGNQRSRE